MMRASAMALATLVGWMAIGTVGVWVSWSRQEHAKAYRGLTWIAGVFLTYLLALVLVSRVQPQKRLAPGQEECFSDLCLSISGVQELHGTSSGLTPAAPKEARLVRVSIRIVNRAAHGMIALPTFHASVLDTQGRRSGPVPGLSGVSLGTPVLPGRPIVSQPVFRLPGDAQHLALILSRGSLTADFFEIGNPDSWLHRPTLLLLGP